MNKNRLLQMSTAVVDLVYRIDELPAVGTDKLASAALAAAGGGFNAMLAARRAGMDVAYGGPHGSGLFSDIVRRALADAGIPALQARSTRADQGSCIVLIDDAGERTFVSKKAAEGLFDDGHLANVDASDFGWVLLSGYELSGAAAQGSLDVWLKGMARGPRLVFDPSPVVANVPRPILADVLSQADWISANNIEASMVTGISHPREAAIALADHEDKTRSGAVVRCGSDGCWVALRGQKPVQVKGYRVATVDTNGAGDTHVGAFIAALAAGENPVEAARYANAAAALSTMYFGPSTAPHDREVREILATNAASASASEIKNMNPETTEFNTATKIMT